MIAPMKDEALRVLVTKLEAATAACPTSGWVTDHVGIYAVKDGVEDSIMIASVYADGGLDRDDHLRHAEMIEAASPDNIRALLDALTTLEAENARLREALTTLVNAKALSGVRDLVAGWNGENRPEGPYETRHPSCLGATLPKTNCGAVYELDEAMQAARTALGETP